MEYFLSDKEKIVAETARELAEKYIKPVRAEYDEKGIFPWDIVKAMGKADLCGIYIPEEYGGLNLGVFGLSLAVEEMSKICGGITLAMAATALGTFPLLLYGNKEQKSKYLPDIASGKLLSAFGLTEANAGSDAGSIQTKAVKDGDFYVLNGTKTWITNGEVAGIYTVIAVTDKTKGARGTTAFLVDKGTPGFSFGRKEEKMGIRASSTTELIFEDCKVHKSQILAREGVYDDVDKCWFFIQGQEIFFDAESGKQVKNEVFEKRYYRNYKEDPDIMKLSMSRPKDLSLFELQKLLNASGDSDSEAMRPFAVKLASNWASPFACLIVVAIAIPFSKSILFLSTRTIKSAYSATLPFKVFKIPLKQFGSSISKVAN